MKVKIQNRSVYHKFTEVEIEIDKKDYQEYVKFNTSKGNFWYDIQDYLSENENLWKDKIDKAISKAEYEFGLGLGDGMDEEDQDSEWRYECKELKTGGHL